MREGLLVLIAWSFCILGISQSSIARFTMDCTLEEAGGNFADLSTLNFPSCECGILTDAFEIGGLEQLVVDTAVSTILNDDFAISFYFQPTVIINSTELITMGNNCSSDSLLRIYFLSDMNEVVFEVNESILEGVSLRGEIKANKCWQHIVASREGNTFTLYINGDLVDEIIFGSDIVVGDQQPFQIGSGACTGIISNDFVGLIDEVEFFDQHLQAFRVRQLYRQNDEIISNDTTIFLGDVISIEATENCTGNISWTPAIGVNSTTAFITDIEGVSSQNYVATFIGDFCIARDTITIFVVDPDDVECEGLLLPNVFTPNGDGLNDDFGILNGFIVEDLMFFEIYDRWGEKIYETTEKSGRWDGTYKGKAINSNMVVYKIGYTCNSKNFVKTGNLSILR